MAMTRRVAPPRTLPLADFMRALRRQPDTVAVCLVAAILFFSLFLLVLPVSRTVQIAALRRFQLADWPFAAWAAFQPLPSMYNFENRWDVTFSPKPGAATDEACGQVFHGFINHHIFNRILLMRAQLERCGLPAQVRFRATYRNTTVESRYQLTAGPGLHGLIVTPQTE